MYAVNYISAKLCKLTLVISMYIKENQFSQNWNASLDKYGVVRYTGAGTKHITNHPHTNTNFVPGGGLFSFSQDILPNIIN